MTTRTAVRRTLTLIGSATVAAIALVACAAPATTPTPDVIDAMDEIHDAMMGDYGLTGMDAVEIIDAYDAMPMADRPTDLRFSIRPDGLMVMDADRETVVEMPEDMFYVSMAPYIDQTHDCYFHSLTTCTGELGNVEMHITVTDADGEIVLDETMTTFDNGFVGMWLPWGIDGEVTVEYDGMTATGPLSTMTAEDPTCITTMQLG